MKLPAPVFLTSVATMIMDQADRMAKLYTEVGKLEENQESIVNMSESSLRVVRIAIFLKGLRKIAETTKNNELLRTLDEL